MTRKARQFCASHTVVRHPLGNIPQRGELCFSSPVAVFDREYNGVVTVIKQHTFATTTATYRQFKALYTRFEDETPGGCYV